MNKHVFIAGDSYTEASELELSQSYVSKLTTKFPHEKYVVDFTCISTSGITSSDLLDSVKLKLNSQITHFNPQLFIWQCGTNDCRYLGPNDESLLKSIVDQFFNNLLSIQSNYSASSIYIAPPLLFTESHYAAQFNPGLLILRQYLLEMFLPTNPLLEIIDLNLLVKQDKSLFVDQIHLNARAHALIADCLSEKIKLMLDNH